MASNASGNIDWYLHIVLFRACTRIIIIIPKTEQNVCLIIRLQCQIFVLGRAQSPDCDCRVHQLRAVSNFVTAQLCGQRHRQRPCPRRPLPQSSIYLCDYDATYCHGSGRRGHALRPCHYQRDQGLPFRLFGHHRISKLHTQISGPWCVSACCLPLPSTRHSSGGSFGHRDLRRRHRRRGCGRRLHWHCRCDLPLRCSSCCRQGQFLRLKGK
mmetsp:Transcript_3771/g.10673  ORF Transcript_3771/g.10673 Transcript_3771/m.10673 type:complete len:212 (-) Transcript_3771:2398-3033(-)